MYIFLAFSIVGYTVGEVSSKLYATTNRAYWFALAVVAYGLTACGWLLALKTWNHFIILGMVYSVGYGIITVAVGLLFKEQITTTQSVGVGLAFASMLLLNQS